MSLLGPQTSAVISACMTVICMVRGGGTESLENEEKTNKKTEGGGEGVGALGQYCLIATMLLSTGSTAEL